MALFDDAFMTSHSESNNVLQVQFFVPASAPRQCSLSEWPLTICLTPYNRKIKCVECVVK